MLFQVPNFLLFLTIFIVFLLMIPRSWVKVYSLLASILFYSFWHSFYVFFLLSLILFSWGACTLIYKNKKTLSIFIILSLVPLLYFKYTNFFLSSFHITSHRLNLVAPLGISFVTFTLISMMIDLAKSRQKPATLLDISLYVTFFPHLLAGPILRSTHLIPQLGSIKARWENIAYNLPLFAVGIIKKVIFADTIGQYVDTVYASPATFSSPELLLALFGFPIQIYCDFSAYSDMAIAVAGMLNIQFPENFRSPYISQSFTEIWRRWHITLSHWLRDYLYFPLRTLLDQHIRYIPVVLTMVISGLWHGASWTFVVWGLLQGLVMSVEHYSGYTKTENRTFLMKGVCMVFTFVLWSCMLVLFRATSLMNARAIYMSIARFRYTTLTDSELELIGLIVIVLLVHPVDNIKKIRTFFQKSPPALLAPVMLGIIVSCAMIAGARPQNFYYFDF